MSPSTQDAVQVQVPTLRSMADSPVYGDIVRSISDYLASSDRPVTPHGGAEPDVETTVRGFHERFRSGADCGYLRNHYLGGVLPELERAIYEYMGIDSWLLHPGNDVNPWFWLFVGGTGTGSKLHLDVVNSAAWNIVLEGEKHWEIQPPALAVDREVLPPGMLDQPGVSASREVVTVVQKAGDLIQVPSGWCHRVTNAGPTVAVTGNYVSDDNETLVRHFLTETGDRMHLGLLDQLTQLVRQGRRDA